MELLGAGEKIWPHQKKILDLPSEGKEETGLMAPSNFRKLFVYYK